MHRPPLILADEPTAALDAKSTADVVELFRELARTHNSTILIVTHDDRILKAADRIVNLGSGHIKTNILTEKVELIGRLLVNFERERPDSEVQLFSRLSPDELTDVADKMQLRQYAEGEEIIRQGEIGTEFFVIARGDVDIEINSQRVNTLSEGSFFGELALMQEQPRIATVRAINDVVCFILDKQEFQAILDDSPTFEDRCVKRSSTDNSQANRTERGMTGSDFLQLQPQDNVAVALSDLSAGAECGAVVLSEPIAAGHKFALTDIGAGAAVIKYGCRLESRRGTLLRVAMFIPTTWKRR